MNSPDNHKPDAQSAREALQSIDTMQQRGAKLAQEPNWASLAISLGIFIGFALYALPEPGNLPGLFILLTSVLVMGIRQSKAKATARKVRPTAKQVVIFLLLITSCLTLFFGGIYLRRAFELPWLPIVTGAIAAVLTWLAARK